MKSILTEQLIPTPQSDFEALALKIDSNRMNELNISATEIYIHFKYFDRVFSLGWFFSISEIMENVIKYFIYLSEKAHLVWLAFDK